jgi:zinc transport system substrate-binding protein
MMKTCKTTLSALTISLLVLTGCSNSQPTASESDKLQIVTSFYPMYDFAKNVGGEHAEVSTLIPAGVEPHDWEPTPKDIERIQQADVFIYNGGGFEHWVEQVLDSLKKDHILIIEASKGIELMEGEKHDHDDEPHDEHKDEHGHDEHPLDPHVWLDPVLAQTQVRTIAEGLQKADPKHRDAYQRNADAFVSQLVALDRSFKSAVESAKNKEFVTQHAAFGYLAKRYGLTQLPISGLSPDQEPSTAQMKEIVAEAKAKNIRVIYFETLVSPKVAEVVAKEIGAETAILNPIEGLTEEERNRGESYLSLMQKNLEELKKTLQP